jgi:hypothetical protein
MKAIYGIALTLYTISDLYIILKLQQRQQKVAVKATAVSFGAFFLFSLAILFLDLKISYVILLLAATALFLNAFIGYYLRYFIKSRVVDRFLHAYGTFSLTLLLYNFIIIIILNRGSKPYQTLFIVFFGIALGAVHEIMEFLADIKQNSQMQKGLRDTNVDTIFNILGAASAATAAYFFLI